MCRESDEGPMPLVTLTEGFYMQKTEVTQQQWVDVFGENPSFYVEMNRPVERITWFDACIYCNRLSVASGLTPSYYSDASYETIFDGAISVTSGTVYWKQNVNGYRLPTEAEWEYACRAGTTAPYNSGNLNTDCSIDPVLDPLGWYYGNSYTESGASTHGVGLKEANNWDLYDMHGNVWEWCWDWYGDYPSGSVTDPMGATSGSSRVLRGGAWNHGAKETRSANRNESSPGLLSKSLGFRIVRVSP